MIWVGLSSVPRIGILQMSIQIASDPVLFCAFPLKEQDRRSQSTMHVLG